MVTISKIFGFILILNAIGSILAGVLGFVLSLDLISGITPIPNTTGIILAELLGIEQESLEKAFYALLVIWGTFWLWVGGKLWNRI